MQGCPISTGKVSTRSAPPYGSLKKPDTHTEAGEGLIFYGNVVLPFIDRFPKDTELYRVMTTKPEEVGDA